MKQLLPYLVLPSIATGALLLAFSCRTPGTSSVKDDGVGGGDLHCLFTTPLKGAESWEIWATPSDGSQLTNVRERYVAGHGEQGDINDAGTAQAVSMDTVTKGGTLKFRAYLKNLVNVNYSKFLCYSVDGGDGHGGYLCLGKGRGGQSAIWATQATHMRYTSDLTLFTTTCTGS